MVFALCMLWTTLVIPNTMGLGGFFRREDRMVFHLSQGQFITVLSAGRR